MAKNVIVKPSDTTVITTKDISLIGSQSLTGTAPHISFDNGLGGILSMLGSIMSLSSSSDGGGANSELSVSNTGASITCGDSGITANSEGVTIAGNVSFTLAIYIKNNSAAATANAPIDGGVLYVDGGALYYRGSSNTVTPLAVA